MIPSRVIADLWDEGVELPPALVRRVIESEDIPRDLVDAIRRSPTLHAVGWYCADGAVGDRGRLCNDPPPCGPVYVVWKKEP